MWKKYGIELLTTFCINSIHSKILSYNGVSKESDTDDIIYGTFSVWTGMQTAFVRILQNFSKSVEEKLKLIRS